MEEGRESLVYHFSSPPLKLKSSVFFFFMGFCEKIEVLCTLSNRFVYSDMENL